MNQHRRPARAIAAPGPLKKLLLCGALPALLWWPGLAAGQSLTEPPPVESFSLDSTPQAAPEGDAALTDLYNEVVQNAAPIGSAPPPTGGAPLPPGTPLYSAPPSEAAPAASANPFPPPVQNTPSPFPPVNPPPEGEIPFAASPASSATLPLGQGAALPQPDWQNASGPMERPDSQFVSDAPEPQFDASQGQWMELEIGQSDRAGTPPPAAGPPVSVPTARDTSAQELDTMMDNAAAPSPPVGGIRTPEGREQLRSLFSDVSPSDGLEAPALPAGQPAPPVPNFSALPPSSTPTPAGQPAPAEDYDGSSAILKAGGLLGQEEHYGNAEILPPLGTEPPAKTTAPTTAPATKAVIPTKAPEKPAVKQPTKTAPAKASAPKKTPRPAAKKQAAPQAAPATLAIVNDTGNPRVGDIYRSVLSRMGHRVVAVSQGGGGGQAGRTIIRYSPGRRAQAQAVARRLPGEKVLAEATGGSASAPDITIYIR